MRVLLTNDDGIHSAGLKALADACLERGHTVTVCAPASQQSAASQRITITAPLMVRSVPWEGAKAWAVQGSPADCARLGLRLAEEPVDFVLSGINDGFNAGAAVYYSGTVAAAREARMNGKRAMAVSVDFRAAAEVLAHLARLAVRLAEPLAEKEWPGGRILNLNAPNLPPEQWKPLRTAPLSEAFFLDTYDRRVSPRGQIYYWLGEGMETEPHRPDTDMDLLGKGHPVLTLLGGWNDDGAWIERNMPEL